MSQTLQGPRIGINWEVNGSLVNQGTVVLSDLNNVTFGMQTSGSSYVITARVGIIQTISAGTTMITSGQAVFSNSNGISFGLNGQTLTAQLAPANYWDNQNWYGSGANITLLDAAATARMYLQRVSFARQLPATRADFIAVLNDNSTAVTHPSGSYTASLGAYTLIGSTASLVSSASTQITWNGTTTASAASNHAGQEGTAWRSISLGTWSITPGEYLIALALSLANTTGGAFTFFNPLGCQLPRIATGAAGLLDAAIRAPGGGDYTFYFADGIYSTTVPIPMPTSLHLSDINQTFTFTGTLVSGAGTATATNGLRFPYLQLAGTF